MNPPSLATLATHSSHGFHNHTPAPPFNSLGCHIILSWSPTSNSKASASGLILQVLGQDTAGIFTGLCGDLAVDI